MKKTFICVNKHFCVGADYWTAHEVTISEEDTEKVIPIEDRAVAKLAIGETYINKRMERIVTRIA